MLKHINSVNNGAEIMQIGSSDGGHDGEHKDVRFVEKFNTLSTQDELFNGRVSFDKLKFAFWRFVQLFFSREIRR